MCQCVFSNDNTKQQNIFFFLLIVTRSSHENDKHNAWWILYWSFCLSVCLSTHYMYESNRLVLTEDIWEDLVLEGMIILKLELNMCVVTGFSLLKVRLFWALITLRVVRNSETVCLSGTLLLGYVYTTVMPMCTWHCSWLQPLMWVVVIITTNRINEVEFTP